MSFSLKSNRATASDDLVERGQITYRERLASILEPSYTGEFVALSLTQANMSWETQPAWR